MTFSSLDAMLKLSKTTSPQKLFPSKGGRQSPVRVVMSRTLGNTITIGARTNKDVLCKKYG